MGYNRERIALITQCFPPESHAGANRLGALARAIAERAQLTVVSLRPSYPDPWLHSGLNVAKHDAAFSFHVLRLAAFHPHRGSYAVRAFREARMAARLSTAAAGLSPERIWATSPSVFVGLTASRLARRRRVPFVWDIRDLTWEYLTDETAYGLRGLMRATGASFLRQAVRFTLQAADQVMVSNTGIRDAIVELGKRPEEVAVVPNGVSADLLEMGERLAERPMGDQPRITYAGAIGYYQGLDALLDVAERMPDVEVCIVGEGPVRHRLQQKVKERALRNVVFTGYVDRARLFAIYEQSDVLFASLRDSPAMGAATFPSKPFEYMAAGRPIVYSGRGITADFLMESGCALIAEPENPESIATAVQRLLDDRELWDRLARQGKVEAWRHLREDLMEKAVDFVLGPYSSERPVLGDPKSEGTAAS